MKKTSSKDRAAASASKRAASLWSYAILPLLAGIGAIALLVTVVLGRLLPLAADALVDRDRETYASTYVALLDGRIGELRRSLATAADAPTVREALAGTDPEALRQTAALIGSVLEFPTRVELFPPGAARLDADAEIPISYAALDLIKRAESGQFVGPEAIVGERSAIYAAQPVAGEGGAVLGVLFTAIDANFFLSALSGMDPDKGELILEQAFDQSRPLGVLSWGRTDAAAIPERLSLSVPHWTLVYRHGRPTVPAAFDGTPVLIAAAVALGLMAIALIVAFYRLALALRHDVSQLRRVLLEPHAGSNGSPYRLAQLAELSESLTRTAQAPSPAPATPIEPLPKEPVARQGAPAEEYLQIEGSETDSAAESAAIPLDTTLFHASGIDGLTTSSLTTDLVHRIGRAYAAEALQRGLQRIVVGRDGRHSSLPLRDALAQGLTEGGVDVEDLGEVPTPVLYFAVQALGTDGAIMITGSHQAPAHNGLSMMLGGAMLAGDDIQRLRDRIERQDLPDPETLGRVRPVDLKDAYLEQILSDVVVAQPLKVVVDGGNGVAGALATELISRLDCDVVPLYCDVDGDFPNHAPDPGEPRNLQDLITVVKAEGADLGIALDGDGNRIGVVTGSGAIVWPDRLLMLFAQDIVGRNPGADIIYDVKCSRQLSSVISELGGRPILWKSGPASLKAKLQETGALLAGEFAGHICFGERWYGFDDALYATARLLEILGAAHESADAVFAQFPQTASTPELAISADPIDGPSIVERLMADGQFGTGTMTTVDGVRVDFEDGWGLIQSTESSTGLTARFEADDEQALTRIRAIFAAQLNRIAPELNFR